jgi:SPP1 family phage portal protein
MEELLNAILTQLKADPEKAIAEIKTKAKNTDDIDLYIKEYYELDRSQRDGQIDQIQRDKSLKDNKLQKMVKIQINHAQNIVETLAAFVVGKPVTLMPSVDNDLSELIKNIWRVNRMDSKILKSTMIKMSETQVAINFYINDIEPTSIFNKILVNLGLKTQAKEIKVKVLDNQSGAMTPYFDSTGNMILFMWQYQTTENSNLINHVQIWDQKNLHYLNDSEVKMQYVSLTPHGFDRIPMVYDDQREPQWYAVKSPADRHEVAISKLGDSNDYSGHPILVTEGEVKSMPLKEESGKHFNIPIKYDEDGNEIKGKVSFLEAETAPESNRLEIEKLEDIIAYGSGVPNLTLEKLKELGNVAEKTVKLMFLGTELKAELKRTDTRTFIERCINVLISGVVTTTNTGLVADSQILYYDIHFNSILPSDISERVTTVSKAVESGLMSKQTGVSLIDLVDDVDDELELIKNDRIEVEPINTGEQTE